MKLKRIIASALAGVMLAASLAAQPIGAVNTFDSPASLIAALATQSLAGITSSTMDTALSTLASDVTLSENTVLYKGNVLGYWFADASDKMYADAERTTAVIEETANGFNVSPTTLRTILADVNNNLKEVSQFTDEEITDWSSLIGKYDIRLGSTTIPASQWIDLTPSADPYADGNTVNAFKPIGYDNIGAATDSKHLTVMGWAIDTEGNLYLSDEIRRVQYGVESGGGKSAVYYCSVDSTTTQIGGLGQWAYFDSANPTDYPYLAVGLRNTATALYSELYVTNSAKLATKTAYTKVNLLIDPNLRKANEASVVYSGDTTALKRQGAVIISGTQLPSASDTAYHKAHLAMFGGQQATYTEVGNSLLSRRLDKLSSMAASDSLAVSADGWTVNGSTPIEEYLASSEFTGDPAEGASMGSYAEFEPLSFKVVVPTNLPVYVSALGEVSTASNATIFNKSNAAIKINTVAVEASSTTNWTLVDENPSDVRGANEFTFTTSLTPGTSIAHDEALPFTYSAKLSPVARDTNIADLAVVKVTFDWDID